MILTKKQRAELFNMFEGHCAYCGGVLPEKGWHADHVEPIYREWYKAHRSPTTSKWDGEKFIQVEQDRKVTPSYPERDVIENFMPACRRCNLHKTAYSLESWRLVLEQQVRMAQDYSRNYQMAERFGLVAQVKTKVVFYFETLLPAAPYGEEKP
jgi:hypothetical protein